MRWMQLLKVTFKNIYWHDKVQYVEEKSEYKEIYAMLLFIKSHIAKWLAGST